MLATILALDLQLDANTILWHTAIWRVHSDRVAIVIRVFACVNDTLRIMRTNELILCRFAWLDPRRLTLD